jgi:hypothetical protein
MKYLLFLVVAASLFGCQKKENACPLYMDDLMAYSPLVFAFIDADSTNLLENHTIDTTQILIKDLQGNPQKFTVFLDSTNTKARYITVPTSQREGTNALKIQVKNTEASLTYNFTRIVEPCGSYSILDNYVLNGTPYQIQPKKSYFMRGKEKIRAFFSVIYIKTSK